MNVSNTTGHRCRQRRRESDNLGPRRRKTWRQLYIIRKIGACSENYNSFEEDRHVMYSVINRPDGPPVIIVCYTGCTNKSFSIGEAIHIKKSWNYGHFPYAGGRGDSNMTKLTIKRQIWGQNDQTDTRRFQNRVGTSYLTEIDARQKDLQLSVTSRF